MTCVNFASRFLEDLRVGHIEVVFDASEAGGLGLNWGDWIQNFCLIFFPLNFWSHKAFLF